MKEIFLNNTDETVDFLRAKYSFLSNGTERNEINTQKCSIPLDSIVFILYSRGSCKLKLNSRFLEIKENMILTMLPGSVWEVIELSDDFMYEYIFFSVDSVYDLMLPDCFDLFKKITIFPLILISQEQFEYLYDFHALMIKHYNRKRHFYKKYLIKNILATFLVEICNIYSNHNEKKYEVNKREIEIFQEFYKLLLENIKNNRSVQFYAEKMYLSPKYLSRIIKEISGKPAMYWINGFCITKIKIMLKSSTLSVFQISEELNFPNPSFFCHYFKKHTGMTPLHYRNN